jgi:hypothetical protein
MGSLMDLVAGDLRDILLVLTIDDIAAFDDEDRFTAHLALGGGLDPTWLDLFSGAARLATGRDDPVDLLDARTEIAGADAPSERIVELVDRAWVEAVAQIDDDRVGPVAARWIELLEEELGPLPREEKPWIRDLTARIVTFARRASGAPDVVFAWAF